MMTKRSTDATMLQERTEYDYVPIEQPDQPDDIPNDEYTFPFQDPRKSRFNPSIFGGAGGVAAGDAVCFLFLGLL